jgi:hypothetical protein
MPVFVFLQVLAILIQDTKIQCFTISGDMHTPMTKALAFFRFYWHDRFQPRRGCMSGAFLLITITNMQVQRCNVCIIYMQGFAQSQSNRNVLFLFWFEF